MTGIKPTKKGARKRLGTPTYPQAAQAALFKRNLPVMGHHGKNTLESSPKKTGQTCGLASSVFRSRIKD
jgi:hypothetical protein